MPRKPKPPKPLTPLFKWTGGKRQELGQILPHLPENYNENNYTFVEPFVGGGAVYWSLRNQNHNLINDYDFDVTNFYVHVQSQHPEFLAHLNEAGELFKDKSKVEEQKKFYYMWRNLDRNGNLSNLTNATRAARFWILNQLAFSGMRRFNRKGESNVPFGNYSFLNPNKISQPEYVSLLQKTTIMNGDYSNVLQVSDKENTFVFVDPPYTRVMNTYSAGNVFDDVSHEKLAEHLKGLRKAKFMLVIDKSPFTETLYAGYVRTEYSLRYQVNIKNRFDAGVKHLLITNY